MPEEVIELRWRCHACRSENLGRYKLCPSCGNTKSDRDVEYAPQDTSSAAAVTDRSLLAQFNAGPDWRCKYCGGHERNDRGECARCGAGQRHGEARGFGQPVPGAPGAPAWQAPGAPAWQAAPAAVQQVDEPIEIPRSFFARNKWYFLGGVGALFALLLWLVLRTRELEVKVGAVQWEHVVVVERYAVYHREGFTEAMPASAFNVTSRGQRVHHYDKVLDHYETRQKTRRVKCGEDCRDTQDCRTTSRSCRNSGNGSMKCTGGDRVCTTRRSCTTRYCDEHYTVQEAVYRDEPRYATWFTWDNWEWAENRRVRASGTTCDTRWPGDDEVHLKANLGKGEDERARNETSYKVTFRDGDGDEYPYVPQSVDEFGRYAPGSSHRIAVSTFKDPVVLRD